LDPPPSLFLSGPLGLKTIYPVTYPFLFINGISLRLLLPLFWSLLFQFFPFAPRAFEFFGGPPPSFPFCCDRPTLPQVCVFTFFSGLCFWPSQVGLSLETRPRFSIFLCQPPTPLGRFYDFFFSNPLTRLPPGAPPLSPPTPSLPKLLSSREAPPHTNVSIVEQQH